MGIKINNTNILESFSAETAFARTGSFAVEIPHFSYFVAPLHSFSGHESYFLFIDFFVAVAFPGIL